MIEEHPHRLIGNEKCFSCSTTVFRFYPQKCCKLFCGAAQLMGVLFKWPVLQYCSAAEMCWVQIFFSTCSFGTNANNCHHFIIVFSENEHCDAKMSIPTNLNITITVYNYYYCFFFMCCSPSVLVLDLCFLGFTLYPDFLLSVPLVIWQSQKAQTSVSLEIKKKKKLSQAPFEFQSLASEFIIDF